MTLISSLITGTVALLGVFLGGLLAIRNQDRLWSREHERRWRDIRLQTHGDFVAAYRAMMAYISSPDVTITSAPHPRRSGEMIPYFDEIGREIRERMEAAVTKIRLVSLSAEAAYFASEVTYAVRDLAGARASHSHDQMPDELFTKLFALQQRFLTAARSEVDLPELPDAGRGIFDARNE